MNDITELVLGLSWMGEDIMKLAESTDHLNEFEIDGIKYTLKKDYHKYNNNEQIWVQEQLKNPNLDKQEIALAVMLRRLKEDGTPERFNTDFAVEVLTILKYKISLVKVIKHVTFFLPSSKESLEKTSKAYSLRKK